MERIAVLGALPMASPKAKLPVINKLVELVDVQSGHVLWQGVDSKGLERAERRWAPYVEMFTTRTVAVPR